MEILYKKEKEEADQLLEQQRLVSSETSEFDPILSCEFHGLRQLSAATIFVGVDGAELRVSLKSIKPRLVMI